LKAFKHKESKVPPMVWVPMLLAARFYRSRSSAVDDASKSTANAFSGTIADLQGLSFDAKATDPNSDAYRIAQAIVALARQLDLFPDSSVLSDEQAIRDQLIFNVNNFSLTDKTIDMTGFGVYPGAALMNHSCAPNVVLCYGFALGKDAAPSPTAQIVRTLLPLKKGDELLHSYVDVTKSVSDRRKELNAQYSFSCNCSACDVEEQALVKSLQLEEAYAANADVARARLMLAQVR
jgi:hypothetical protein